MKDLILSVDCGTQSTRAMLFDKKGNLVAKSKVAFKPYFTTEKGRCEQHPEFYYEQLCKATNELVATNPELKDRIAAMTITTIRDTFICVDEDYNAVAPCIMWLDQRKAPITKADVPLIRRLIFKLVGMYDAVIKQMTNGFSNWIMKCDKDTWAKTAKYISYGGYLAHRLTGAVKDAVAANVGHIPINYRKQKWHKKSNLQSCLFPIEKEKLPELVPTGTDLGGLTAQAALDTGLPQGLKLIACGSDKACETLGVGCISDKSASLSYGTTATIQITTDKYKEPIPFMPSYPAVINGRFNPEVQIYRGYWMITWFKEEFAKKEAELAALEGISVEEYLDRELNDVPAGCDGLVLQPFWQPGLKEPEGRGCMVGFTDAHSRKHIFRAIIEGICFGLYEGMLAMQKKTGKRIEFVTVSGGGSCDDNICQITADVFGLPVKRVQTYETSGLGAAIVGFLGLGEYDSVEKAVENMVHYSDKVFHPDEKNHQTYQRIFKNVYSKLYKRVKPLYLNMIKNEKEAE